MKEKKNLVTISLMVSSVMLLIILQIFWLRGSYKQAFYDFRREANMLFRTTVLDLRDSLLIKNIRPIAKDSLPSKHAEVFAFDTLTIRKTRTERMTIEKSSADVQIYVTQNDSVVTHDILGPLASRIQSIDVSGSPGIKSFMIRLTDDSLKTDIVQARYLHALQSASIEVPFIVKHQNKPNDSETLPGLPQMRKRLRMFQTAPEHEPAMFSDSVFTEPVHINPVHQYQAAFYNVNSKLLQAIAPQILFSIFLTVMISGAFLLMYRNLKTQQKLMELKNDFISNVTHELKTPVATVSVALEALKKFKAGSNPKLSEEYLDIAQNELNRLTLMMDKILKASIFENKGVNYTPEKVDLKVVIDQVLASLKLVFEKKNATINFITTGEDFTIQKGSALHLTNVIYNLLDNAIKYSKEEPTIEIQLKQDGDQVSFHIKDNGIGIAREYRKKIFEKFFRVPTGDIHTIKGYGLGLNYVERVVESHHGKISLESEPEIGSTFYVVLPRF